jgi:thymidylate synthase
MNMIRSKVQDIRNYFKKALEAREFVTDKTGCEMLELRSASFIADEPAIIGTPNEDYIKREIEWYMSCSLNVNDIPGQVPAIWKQVATKDGLINSNYGWCIFSFENGNQFHRVENELREKPDSRRAAMIYTRPSMWEDYNIDGMSDFMCTNTVQYMIRNDMLEAHVQMRSNDVWAGYRNDYAWQKHVLDMLANKLDVLPGDIYWNVGSLHVYSRHFHLVK